MSNQQQGSNEPPKDPHAGRDKAHPPAELGRWQAGLREASAAEVICPSGQTKPGSLPGFLFERTDQWPLTI
jgi:hypothetical protein